MGLILDTMGDFPQDFETAKERGVDEERKTREFEREIYTTFQTHRPQPQETPYGICTMLFSSDVFSYYFIVVLTRTILENSRIIWGLGERKP
jgi:hypothetical protein